MHEAWSAGAKCTYDEWVEDPKMRFRIRSAARDESADTKRLGVVERSLRKVIADAEVERNGLNRRIQDAKTQTAMLIGNDTFEYMDREAATEQELSISEQSLMAAEKRMRQLTAHIAHLQRVLATVHQT
jgi:hypothetical protein